MSTTITVRKEPEEYAGEPRCVICSVSPDGVFFPNCASTRADGTRYTHDETCRRYAAERDRSVPDEWLCPRCELAEAAAEYGGMIVEFVPIVQHKAWGPGEDEPEEWTPGLPDGVVVRSPELDSPHTVIDWTSISTLSTEES